MKLEITLAHWELRQSPSARAAGDAFGLDQYTIATIIQSNSEATLVVTAEQFGQFVALRSAYGGVNRIQTLKPKLIVNPIVAKLDVTNFRMIA